MPRIVITDLGTGNLRSVCKAIQYVTDSADIVVTDDAEIIGNADYLILPGQGAIGTWMAQLKSRQKLEQAICDRLEQVPVLGICLGLQAMFDLSEENQGTPCLGKLKGVVKHFHSHSRHKAGQQKGYKVPHMGWNEVAQTRPHPLWQGITDDERFYFVHSYYVESGDRQEVMGTCEHGNRFTAAAGRGNLFATQFHPEKSQNAGLRLLKNFVNWNGDF